MAKGKVWYRYVGEVPGELASGQPLEPGAYIELTGDEVNDMHNADLIVNGQLIEASEKLAKQAEDQGQEEQATEEAGEEGS